VEGEESYSAVSLASLISAGDETLNSFLKEVGEKRETRMDNGRLTVR
jgi:hypothetical protein